MPLVLEYFNWTTFPDVMMTSSGRSKREIEIKRDGHDTYLRDDGLVQKGEMPARFRTWLARFGSCSVSK